MIEINLLPNARKRSRASSSAKFDFGAFMGNLSARFQAYLAGQDPPRARWDALGEVVEDAGAWGRHLEAILALPELDRAGLRRRAFHVALDCVHGAGGLVMPSSFESPHVVPPAFPGMNMAPMIPAWISSGMWLKMYSARLS